METDDEEFSERWSELVENVQHHVEEEESELLPLVDESQLDLGECAQMKERKEKAIDELRQFHDAHFQIMSYLKIKNR